MGSIQAASGGWPLLFLGEVDMVDKIKRVVKDTSWQTVAVAIFTTAITVIVFLTSLGVNSILNNQERDRREAREALIATQKEWKESQDRQDNVIALLCNQLKEQHVWLQKHDDWLRVPWPVRKENYFDFGKVK
jgi:high-affinity K+ transport system ATPase subunit B